MARAVSSIDNARHFRVQRTIEQRFELVARQRLQYVDRGARQQRANHFERWILGRGADEHEQARLDVRQERILLRFVEPVHLVDKHDRRLAGLRARHLRALDGIADVLHSAQHRRDRDEIQSERSGHQARQRRFADTWRSPQDHRVRPARLERHTQRLARSEQMRLPDHIVDGVRAHALGERRAGDWSREQVLHRWGKCH